MQQKINKVKKNIFLLYAQLILFCNLSAQDIIMLQNGDEIKAKVIEVNINDIKYKKYENPEGPSYSLNKSELFKIKYENGIKELFNNTSNKKKGLDNEKDTMVTVNYTYITPKKKDVPEYIYKKSGFLNITELGILNSYLYMFNGYQFDEYISIGLGIEYNKWIYNGPSPFGSSYYSDNIKLHNLPVFLDARMSFLKRKNTPFLFVDIGKTFVLNNKHKRNINYNNDSTIVQDLEFKGRFYSNLGIGFKTFINKQNALHIDLSLNFMSFKIKDPESRNIFWYYNNNPRLVSRISLKAGISF